MSNVIEFPRNKLHPKLRSNPLTAELYDALGVDHFNMLMEMWSAQLYGEFDNWYDRYIKVDDHVEICMEIAKVATEYTRELISEMADDADIIH